MRRSVLVVLVLAACGKENKEAPAPAPAEPVAPLTEARDAGLDRAASPPAPAPTIDYRATASYGAALVLGRKLVHADKFAEATRAFEDALSKLPDDPVALSELSWSAFKAGQLDRAAKAARKSASATGNKRLRAASLYNLGRVLEARAERDGAVAAYLTSYRLRPRPAVAKRLYALGAEIPAGGLQRAMPLAGPATELTELCAEPCVAPVTSGVTGPTHIDEPPPPYRAIGFFRAAGEAGCRLQIATERGIYAGADDLFNCTADRADARVDRLEVVDVVPGGAPEIAVEFSGAWYRVGAVDDVWGAGWKRDHHLVVCGIGATGTPSCTGWFDLGYSDDWKPPADDPRAAEVEPAVSGFRFDYRFDDGALVISEADKQLTAHPMADARRQYRARKGAVGRYPLTFP
jgi:tetratricopeptide (TPR) repeat protein